MRVRDLIGGNRKAVLIVLVFLFWAAPSSSLAPELWPYPSPAEFAAEVRALAAEHPDRAELLVIGRSAGGRELLCLRIHRGDGLERPAALIGGAIHGDEFIANRTAMAAARLLLSGDPAAEEALEKMEVYVLPLINPDGYQATWDSGGELGPKQTRTNDRGVDLNRNFGKPEKNLPLPLGFSGSTDPESTRWVGPAPLSEPETRAVIELAREKKFFAAVDFHSSGGMIIPVLCDDKFTQRGVRKMAWAYRYAQSDPYLIVMFPYRLPVYQGSMEEGLNREAGTLAILIELGKPGDFDRNKARLNHFWRFNPASPEAIDRIADDNARATLSALVAGFDYSGGRTSPRPAEVR